MDQCRYCKAMGDLEACTKIACSIHESWLVIELKKKLMETGSKNFPDYRCLFALCEGDNPGRCLFDLCRPGDCREATNLTMQGKGRNDCTYWRRIEK